MRTLLATVVFIGLGPGSDLEGNKFSFKQWRDGCSNWCFFFIISIIAGVFGFTGISAATAGIAKVLFFIFIIVFMVLLVVGARGGLGNLLGKWRAGLWSGAEREGKLERAVFGRKWDQTIFN